MITKIITWNVNGIRAIQKKGFDTWLLKEAPDILCLQETKAQSQQLDTTLVENDHYQTCFSSAEKKGYSGTAIFSLRSLETPKITYGLGIEQFDREGRTIIAEYPHFFLINGYFPNGQRDHNRVPFKLEYSRAVLALGLQLEKKKPVIICGDLNTSHQEIDLKNPKANRNSTGFLPLERAVIDEFIDQGFVDIYRQLYPEKIEYTWWTYRFRARERNIGWRLDYFFISQKLLPYIEDCQILTSVPGSDHCPVKLTFQSPAILS